MIITYKEFTKEHRAMFMATHNLVFFFLFFFKLITSISVYMVYSYEYQPLGKM